MSSVQHFNFQNTDVRTVDRDGDAWFVLRDVCDVLHVTQPARVAESLDEDEVSTTHVTDSIGRDQSTYIISESGLYSVVLRSRKPDARAFKRWITHEVIPAIRKTGGYQLASPEEQMAQGLIAAQQMLDEKSRQLEETKPKAEFAETFLSANGDYDTRDAAQILRRDHGITNIGQNRLRDWMQRHGWIDAKRRPYQHKIDAGHLRLKPSSFRFKRTNGEEQLADPQLRVTPKGVEALARAMQAGQTMEAA